MIPFRFEATPRAHAGARKIAVPSGIETKSELLSFLAGAFPLPDYFGHNWDALEECLRDLSWLDDKKIALLHHDLPLAQEKAEARTYLQILSTAALASARLSVIFPESSRREIAGLLAL
jgi:hypothetical protein